MPKTAYCGECGRYVQLTAEETCPNGHPRSALRDLREGAPPAPAAAQVAQRPVMAVAGPTGARRAPESAETAGKVVGWIAVVVPATIFAVVCVAITEPQFEGFGIPVWLAWLGSLGTVVVTFALAAVWGWVKFRKAHG